MIRTSSLVCVYEQALITAMIDWVLRGGDHLDWMAKSDTLIAVVVLLVIIVVLSNGGESGGLTRGEDRGGEMNERGFVGEGGEMRSGFGTIGV